MLSRKLLLHYQIFSFFEGSFVHPKMCICLQSRRRHLAAGRFRARRAVRRASVLSALCESQCGRIRRISVARELLVWETEVSRRWTALCNRLWDARVGVWSCGTTCGTVRQLWNMRQSHYAVSKEGKKCEMWNLSGEMATVWWVLPPRCAWWQNSCYNSAIVFFSPPQPSCSTISTILSEA